ncbi:MAG: cysteine desulfurase-like protein [Anaerolineales bacterium]|nr:cysteine desulfurase-like protein [Anaerolineales bacterium]
MPFDIDQVRARFPALESGAVFFDNPGGTQVAQQVVTRMTDYLLRCNANHGGAFKTSVESDAVLHAAHAAMADFLNAASPDEIIFGQNMTSLTFSLSRALGRRLAPGDEIVVTRLDHDANISPWLMLAEDRGARVRWVDIHPEDCTLDMTDFEAQLSDKTKIVACGYASNAVGTINDVRAIVEMAHAAGALCFVDAVQYAPHGSIDVQALDCDLLVCSAYKFFGPHAGILYGRYELLDRLRAYKVRPADDRPPGKFETGTQNHEGQAGALGAIEYFEWLGEQAAGPARGHAGQSARRAALVAAMTALAGYERELGAYLIAGLQLVPGLKIWGLADLARLAQRVPTVSFTLAGWHPRQLAERLAAENIFVWNGNYYALAVMERLGLQEKGGMLRVGLAHYNTRAEVERLLAVLHAVAG